MSNINGYSHEEICGRRVAIDRRLPIPDIYSIVFGYFAKHGKNGLSTRSAVEYDLFHLLEPEFDIEQISCFADEPSFKYRVSITGTKKLDIVTNMVYDTLRGISNEV